MYSVDAGRGEGGGGRGGATKFDAFSMKPLNMKVVYEKWRQSQNGVTGSLVKKQKWWLSKAVFGCPVVQQQC